MGTLIDLSGKRFGHWTVLQRDESNTRKNIYWVCQCDCGTIRSVAGTSLRSGISVSCGCEKDKKTSIRTKTRVEDLTGRRFGHWTVIEQDLSDQSTSKRGARWLCKCDCGRIKSVLGYSLKDGRTTSCGCQSGGRIIDLTGQQYGKLTVVRQDTDSKSSTPGAKWICRCECGKEVSVLAKRLKSGQTKSCGCLQHEKRNYIVYNLIGERFGHWTVLRKDSNRSGNGTYYFCQCDCGNIKSVSSSSLRNGFSTSCGCQHSVPKEDLTGRKFGVLSVLGIDTDYTGRGIHWKCLCECGTIKSYKRDALVSGRVKSCGCLNHSQHSEARLVDLTGKRFGRLTAVKVDHKEYDRSGNSKYYWLCSCDCGNTIVVQASVLNRGDTQSCGCLQAEKSAERAAERLIDLKGKRFGMLTVIDRVSTIDESGHSIGTWKCHCDCGNDTFADGYYLSKGMITSCGCKRQSKYEIYIMQYFDEIGYENTIDYECQRRFEDLRGYGEHMLSYDFAVYSNGALSALIECQGQQHYMPVNIFGGEEQFAKQQLHDELKREYAAFLGVPLIEIPYTVETYEDAKKILDDTRIFASRK